MRGGWVSGEPVDEESRLDREAARRAGASGAGVADPVAVCRAALGGPAE